MAKESFLTKRRKKPKEEEELHTYGASDRPRAPKQKGRCKEADTDSRKRGGRDREGNKKGGLRSQLVI